MMEMPKPTDAHRKLTSLVGRWTGQERIAPTPWDPKGGKAIGRVDNRLAVDGFVVLHDYEEERDGVICFRGHGVFSFDPGEKCYVLHWFDSMGLPPNVFKGNFEGATLRMTCHGPEGFHRATWDFPASGAYRFRMEMSQDGQQWQAFMEGDYLRTG